MKTMSKEDIYLLKNIYNQLSNEVYDDLRWDYFYNEVNKFVKILQKYGDTYTLDWQQLQIAQQKLGLTNKDVGITKADVNASYGYIGVLGTMKSFISQNYTDI
jgi:hypothetical protein